MFIKKLRDLLRPYARWGRRTWTRYSRAARHWFQPRTAALHVLPDFVIIGAQKSGTTSLYSYLVQHPDVVPSLDKYG